MSPIRAADPTISYDAAGLPTVEVQPGGVTTTNTYDNLGRLVQQTGTGAEAATATRKMTYDADGRPVFVLTPTGNDQFTYNDRGLVVDNYIVGYLGGEADFTSTYDAEGRLTSTADPSGGTTTYTYSGLNELATLTNNLTGTTHVYSYNPDGRVANDTEYPVGQQTTSNSQRAYGYDTAGRLASDTVYSSGGTITATQTYGWDGNGNLTSQTTTGSLADPHQATYTYDEDNRLIRAADITHQTGSDYGYDAVGNRTSQATWTGNGTPTTITATTNATYDQRNRLLSTASPTATTSQTWTARGTLSTVTTTPAGAGTPSTQTTSYNAFNQLTSDSVDAYRYDDLGRLAGSTQTGTTYYHNLDREPSAIDQALGVVRGPDGLPIAAREHGTTTDLITNSHGDVTAATNPATGNVTSSRAYDPNGNPIATIGAPSSLGYQGSYTHPLTGKVHTQTRWFDAGTGTFTSRDNTPGLPLGSATDTNLYAYGNANPTTENDPTGQCFLGVCDLVNTVFDYVGKPLENLVGAVKFVGNVVADTGEAIAEGAGALADAAGGIATVVEDAAGVLVCPECVVGAIIVLAVAGAITYYIVNHNGSLSPTHAPATSGQGAPTTGASGSGSGNGAPSSEAQAAGHPAPETSPAPIPPHVVGTGTITGATRHHDQVTDKWYSNGFIFTRTDHYTYTQESQILYYSDGSRRENPFTWVLTSHTYSVSKQPVIDFSHATITHAPKPGKPQQPTIAPAAASTGACGAGSDPANCINHAGQPLPDQALAPIPDGGGGGGKIPAKPAAGSCMPEPPNANGLTEGDVGSFKTLDDLGIRGDNLTPHHMPQAALGFSPYELGATVALSHANHARTRTYWGKGRLTKQADSGRSFQDILNDDFDDLRGLGACFDVEHSINAVQNYYTTNLPGLVQ